MNLKPAKLINKAGTNMCWWNALIQLFSTTRDQSIVDEMTKFINEHANKIHNNNNDNIKQCWYCNIFQAIISTIVKNDNQNTIDFSTILFNVPGPVVDPKDKTKLIYHQFYNFIPNIQQDSFEGCDQLFDVT
jgi:hypothetical protein